MGALARPGRALAGVGGAGTMAPAQRLDRFGALQGLDLFQVGRLSRHLSGTVSRRGGGQRWSFTEDFLGPFPRTSSFLGGTMGDYHSRI